MTLALTEALKPHAELIESRGRKRGHRFGAWEALPLVLPVPDELAGRIHAEAERLALVCEACGAWAAILDDTGATANVGNYDEPCPGSGTEAA